MTPTPSQRAIARAAIEAALAQGRSPSEAHAFARCIMLPTIPKAGS